MHFSNPKLTHFFYNIQDYLNKNYNGTNEQRIQASAAKFAKLYSLETIIKSFTLDLLYVTCDFQGNSHLANIIQLANDSQFPDRAIAIMEILVAHATTLMKEHNENCHDNVLSFLFIKTNLNEKTPLYFALVSEKPLILHTYLSMFFDATLSQHIHFKNYRHVLLGAPLDSRRDFDKSSTLQTLLSSRCLENTLIFFAFVKESMREHLFNHNNIKVLLRSYDVTSIEQQALLNDKQRDLLSLNNDLLANDRVYSESSSTRTSRRHSMTGSSASWQHLTIFGNNNSAAPNAIAVYRTPTSATIQY